VGFELGQAGVLSRLAAKPLIVVEDQDADGYLAPPPIAKGSNDSHV
jgi:hypothetical protein